MLLSTLLCCSSHCNIVHHTAVLLSTRCIDLCTTVLLYTICTVTMYRRGAFWNLKRWSAHRISSTCWINRVIVCHRTVHLYRRETCVIDLISCYRRRRTQTAPHICCLECYHPQMGRTWHPPRRTTVVLGVFDEVDPALPYRLSVIRFPGAWRIW